MAMNMEKINEQASCIGCGVSLAGGDVVDQLTGICSECYSAHLATVPGEKPLDYETCHREALVERCLYLEKKVKQWKHYVKKHVYHVEG
jgi:hypothetical protein